MENKEQLKQAIRSNLGSIKSGKDLSNLFQELFKETVQELLQAEMDEHLGYEKHASNSSHFENSRNGKIRKQVKSKYGPTEIEVPRDRDGSFSPQVLPKRRRVMDDIEDHVLSLYSRGMSTRDIELETRINATPEVCYKLSLNVDLHMLSVNRTKEHIVNGVTSGIMKKGDFVTWRAKHFGIWQTLTTKITQETKYEFFVDEMINGAFKSMRHEHYFIQNSDGTTMRDIFRFESPYGFFGKIFNFLILDNYMRKFLIERNEKVKEVAESDLHSCFL
jgi:ligand-binding SRPBCC domain-containing protein